MGDYNADPDPDLDRIRTVVFDYALGDKSDQKTDQFSTASNDKVYHVVRKIGSTRLQFLVDPSEIEF